MLTHRIKGNIADGYHFVLAFLIEELYMLGGVGIKAAEHLFKHVGNALGGFNQTLTVGILPNGFKNISNGFFYLLFVCVFMLHLYCLLIISTSCVFVNMKTHDIDLHDVKIFVLLLNIFMKK